MLFQNINSVRFLEPVAPQINENVALLNPDKINPTEAAVEAYRGNVEPLAYYCALALVTGMDELLTGCGYCEVDGQRYCEMGETLRAWDRLEAEGLV